MILSCSFCEKTKMPTSSFKSTLRRGNTSGSDNSPKKVPIRRSHSVSSLTRTRQNHQLDIASDFLIKRDNPLFWSSCTPLDKEIDAKNSIGIAKFTDSTTKISATATAAGSSTSKASERGRSPTRNFDVDKKVDVTGRKQVVFRSLSRVDAGRHNGSISRSTYVAPKSEDERNSVALSNYSNIPSANSLKRANSCRNVADMPRTSTDCGALESLDNTYIPNQEDRIAMDCLSEAEEKTIKAVCEQMKSFLGENVSGDTATSIIYETVRSELRRAISDIQSDLESANRMENATSIPSTNVTNVSPDLVNPGANELVLDIRRECTRKLEESQERARKLKADLAIEEQRGQELSRILKEMLPDPKMKNVQKSRTRRKNSSERKRMSKHLTEEAMAYFDECLSISTFDSSDVSAPEYPPLNLIGPSTPQRCSSFSTNCCLNSCLIHKQESGVHGLLTYSPMGSGLTASSNSNEPKINQVCLGGINAERGQNLQFSLSQKPAENEGLQHDIRNYVKNTDKEFDDVLSSRTLGLSYCNADEYLHGQSESLLFDRVMFRNRVDSGSMHLCGGGFSISFSSYGSVI